MLDPLELLEPIEAKPLLNQRPASGINEAHCIAVIGGKFYRLGVQAMPLVDLLSLGESLPDCIPPPRSFYMFFHEFQCTGRGWEGAVSHPATKITDSSLMLWHRPCSVVEIALNGWLDWQHSTGWNCTKLKGLEALRAVLCFRAWAALQNAASVVEWHRTDGGPLSDYVGLSPDIAGQPLLKEYAAQLALTDGVKARGRGKRGRSQSGRNGIDNRRVAIELAALSSLIRKRDGLRSWDKAYETACLERPKWVPNSWGDPVERLRREIERLGPRWTNLKTL